MKVNSELLREYINECGEIDKTFRRGSTFYAKMHLDIDEKLVKQEESFAPLLGYRVATSGYWSDDDGYDDFGSQIVVSKVTRHIEHPEKVIPAWSEPVWEAVDSPVVFE